MCMAHDEKQVMKTKSGRVSKQRFNINDSSRKKIQTRKMLRDESPIVNEEIRSRAIQTERESLERQRRELEQMRQELETERNALRQRQQQQSRPDQFGNPQIIDNQGQNARGLEEITAIIGNMQNLHVDIKLPKFSNETERNPVEFLEEMERFFKLKSINNERRMMMIEHALGGKAAIWFELKINFDSYEQFREQFLEEFYSIPIRVIFKNQWMDRRCSINEESLQTYYYRQVRDARYFIPKLTSYEINYSIIQQYPIWIRETLATVDYSNDRLISQTLASLDLIRRDRPKTRENKSYNNSSDQPRYKAPTVRQLNVGRFEGEDRFQTNYEYQNRRDSWRGRYYDRSGSDCQDHNNRRSSTYAQSQFQLPDTRYPPPNNIRAPSSDTNYHLGNSLN